MSTEEHVEDREVDGGALHRATQQQARVKHTDRVRSGDSSVDGMVVHKVCCVCGEVLNRKTRFKDHEGRYWCAMCNEADQSKVRPIPCADCGIEMPRVDLKDVGGVMLCPVCVSKMAGEGQAVAELHLSALAHAQQLKAREAARTARKVAHSRKPDHVVTLLWVGLGAVVAALMVMLVVAYM